MAFRVKTQMKTPAVLLINVKEKRASDYLCVMIFFEQFQSLFQ